MMRDLETRRVGGSLFPKPRHPISPSPNLGKARINDFHLRIILLGHFDDASKVYPIAYELENK